MRKTLHLVGLLLALARCGPTESPALARLAEVSGTFGHPDGVGGDAWLFLYSPGEGPPGTPAVPKYATAISAPRLENNPHFVFAQVSPNPWKLWGLLDVNANFDPAVDVLAQPGAGDRVGPAVELNVQPGRAQSVDYAALELVDHEPPALRLDRQDTDVRLDDTAANLTSLVLVADSLGKLDPQRTSFVFGLVDANHDGRPDDANGDGVPDLSLQLVLRWLPRPGQAPTGTNVIVPLAYNPAPFLTTLNGNLQARVVVSQVQVLLVPAAQKVVTDGQGQQTLESYGAPPTGDYELLALVPGGQFWRLPNQLGSELPSQSVQFHLDRAAP